ncbi:hypothetical protein ACJX0J_012992, partial [Zea mays]
MLFVQPNILSLLQIRFWCLLRLQASTISYENQSLDSKIKGLDDGIQDSNMYYQIVAKFRLHNVELLLLLSEVFFLNQMKLFDQYPPLFDIFSRFINLPFGASWAKVTMRTSSFDTPRRYTT